MLRLLQFNNRVALSLCNRRVIAVNCHSIVEDYA